MDISKEIENLHSRIKKLRAVQDEIAYMEAWFTVKDGNGHRNPLKVYDYQQEFLVHILEDGEPFYSRKTRQCGITSFYAMHMAYNINKYFRGYREKPLYLYVSCSHMEGTCFLNKVDEFLQCTVEKNSDKEWVLCGNGIKDIDGSYLIKISTNKKIKDSTIGCTFDEIFFDEYEFFDNLWDNELCVQPLVFNGTKLIATSSKNRSHIVSGEIRQEIHWWQIPRLNKNLRWVKEVKEAIIDEEGNIVYDERRFRRFLEEGWKPTSPEYEKLLKAGLNENELF